MRPSLRPVALTLLVFTALPLCRPARALAAAPDDPCERACEPGRAGDAKSRCGCETGDARLQELEQLRLQQERNRLERAARYFAAEQAAQEEQRRRETYKEESVAAMRRRVGGLALAMSATTGCLTALSLYLDKKGTQAGHRSFRPISEGLGGFTVVTGLVGVGFLLSGMRSDSRDVGLQLAPGRMLASLGWRFH
jgi:hypothetical protein